MDISELVILNVYFVWIIQFLFGLVFWNKWQCVMFKLFIIYEEVWAIDKAYKHKQETHEEELCYIQLH